MGSCWKSREMQVLQKPQRSKSLEPLVMRRWPEWGPPLLDIHLSSATKTWRKRRSSYAWDYFEMTSNNKVKCLHCGQELSYSNNTSSMLRHYRAIHEPEEAAKRAETNRGPRKVKVDKALIGMIIKDSQPFSIVEDVGFRELVHVLDPGYRLPNRKSLKAMVEMKYLEAKENAKEHVLKAAAFSLTSDLWTSTNADAVLTVTCHFINESDQLCSTLIGVKRFPKAHTAEDLAQGHEQLMAEWGIRDKVTCLITNGEPVMVAGVTQLNIRHVACIAHTINSIVGKSFEDVDELKVLRFKCKNLVSFFKCCPTANECLVQLLEQMGKRGYRMIIEVEKVWTSTFRMLKCLYDLRAPLVAVMASVVTHINPLTPLDFEMIKDILSILTPIHQASVEISTEKKVFASKIIPMMKMLHHAITGKVQSLTMANVAKQLADSLVQHLGEHIFNVESESALTLATLLDPRFKKHGFVSPSKAEEAVNNLKDQCVIMMTNNDDDGDDDDAVLPIELECAPIEQPTNNGELWQLLDETIRKTKSSSSIVAGASIEVDCFLAEANIKRTEDPLEWWNKSKKQYPNLYKLALTYLCSPASSVPCNQVFSLAGENLAKKRSSLNPNTLEKILFLNEVE
ncbi:zinc finger BED domain-containing protein 4-like [Gouania willdenowi]|uniref:zinc finger BED domain-containing protein 4-like n=1 Tax=Gouania willdenowi TaxID=441366 RepID=UPI0010547A92|nr:zinc finger BED domain-containing protein 4-like [Gouania willdenowi]